ncbi:hypothetical protein [Methylomonas koyamae]|uniref:hypothetical protein n=1 Tax=Methylomonas koyamae TaxID=702114 RepID=UPI002873752A|nr:hypothetical protein [Methylomonas koyamae]WNB74046.1 hypothetical protein RI210_12190 [Methylomonas koyamae]
MSQTNDNCNKSNALGTTELAALIVDALLHGGVLRKDDINRALEIVSEEIDARKAMGDY